MWVVSAALERYGSRLPASARSSLRTCAFIVLSVSALRTNCSRSAAESSSDAGLEQLLDSIPGGRIHVSLGLRDCLPAMAGG